MQQSATRRIFHDVELLKEMQNKGRRQKTPLRDVVRILLLLAKLLGWKLSPAVIYSLV